MSEIKITDFFNDANPAMYSASRMELGYNAGEITWNNAKKCAHLGSKLLNSKDELQAMRNWAKSSGGWNAEEIATWDDIELNALFIQLISGEIREMGDDTWEQYRGMSEDGIVSGCLFEGVDGEIYYYLGE